MNKNQKWSIAKKIVPAASRFILALLLSLAVLPIRFVKAAEPAATTIGITSVTPSPAYIGQTVNVHVRATAVNPLDGNPVGNVEIRSGQDLVCILGLDGAGEGECNFIFSTPATVPLKAFYLGVNAFLPAVSAEVNLLVKNKYTPVVSIVQDAPDPSVINRMITAGVLLTSDGPLPTGNVTVWRSNASCMAPPAVSAVDHCSINLAGGGGTCSLPLTTAGNVNLCATYSGDSFTFPANAKPEIHRVSNSNTFTIITKMDPEPSLLGEKVWVSFQVNSPDGGAGAADLVKVTSGPLTCAGTIAEGRCALTFTTPHLHDVVAEYQGGGGQPPHLVVGSGVLQPSTSDIVVHRVNAAPTSIALSSDRVSVFATWGQKIGSFSASDPNPDETQSFTLVPGVGSENNNLFKISGEKLLLNGVIPQDRSSLSIRIRATDPAGLFFEKAFLVRVSSNSVLPDTGFAAGRITNLLAQPPEKKYQSLGSLELEIPSLSVKTEITGVPYLDAGWDASWLWSQVGWLNGTAFPGWQGNSVLAAHNYLPDGTPGPFARLQTMRWGERVLLHVYGSTYVYEVRDVSVVSPEQASVLRHEESTWLTLVTCKSYDENRGSYARRVVVRAVLVEVQ